MKRYLAIIIACICIAWAGMHYNQGKSRELIQSPNSTTENYGNDSIAFSDSSLEKAIREKISKPSGQIYKVDLENITELEVVSANIKELSGIENLTNLEELDLSFNDINDISNISNLTNLVKLILSHNSLVI